MKAPPNSARKKSVPHANQQQRSSLLLLFPLPQTHPLPPSSTARRNLSEACSPKQPTLVETPPGVAFLSTPPPLSPRPFGASCSSPPPLPPSPSSPREDGEGRPQSPPYSGGSFLFSLFCVCLFLCFFDS